MFVETLVNLSPVVLFSAAVPHQGGADHRNEQWQSYWAKLFNDRGYVTVDCLRKRVWDDTRVGSCYSQNTLFYVKESELSRFPKLKAAYEAIPQGGLDMIHPDYLARVAKRFWKTRQKEKLVTVLKLPVTAVKWLFGQRGEKPRSGR